MKASLPPLRLRWLLMSVVLVAVLPGAALMLQAYREASATALKQAQSDLTHIARLTAESQAQAIEGVRQILATIASGPSVQREALSELCSEFLGNIARGAKAYDTIGVLDLNGDLRCRGNAKGPAPNGADRAYFGAALQAPRGAMVGGEYVISRVTGGKVLVFAMPVFDAEGKLRAVAVAAINLERADARIKALGLPPSLAVRLTDGQGRWLASARSNPAEIGEPLPEPALVQAIQARRIGALELEDSQGQALLVFIDPVDSAPGQQLYVTVSTPRDTALAPARAELRRHSTFLALAAAAGFFLAWWLGLHWLGRPVNQLLRRMDLAGRGDALAHVTSPPSTSVEIAELDASFSRLLAVQGEQEQKLLRAQQIARIGFYEIDVERGLCFGPESTPDMFGLDPHQREIPFDVYQALLHPDDSPRVQEFRQRLLAAPGTGRLRYRILRPNGEVRWIEAVAVSSHEPAAPEAPIRRYSGALRDVTDEERNRRLFAVQSHISEAIVRATSVQALLDAACVIAVDAGLMHLAWLGEADAAGRGIHVRAAAGPGLAYLAAMQSVAVDLLRSQAPVVRALREGQFTLCNDVLNDPDCADWHAAEHAHGVRSMAVLPLQVNERIVMTMVLVADAVNAFNADDERVLKAIAENLSYALSALQAEDRRHDAERRAQAQLARTELLNRITRAIGDRLDLDSVFRVVAETLQGQLPAAFVAVALHEAGSEVVILHCIAGASRELARAAGLAEGAAVAIQRNGLSRCVAGDLVYEPDLAGLDFALPHHLLAAGLHSAVLAPLQGESTVFGLVIVARDKPHAFSSGECEFLRQLGEQVALAASQARLHQKLQHTFDELQRSQKTALQQERLRALGQMASGVAHDINNAIAPVALYTESLLEGEPGLSDRARHYLQVIQRSIDDVAETVVHMREFSRPQPAETRRSTLTLNTLVQQVVEITRARWRDMPQQSGIVVNVRTELADGLPALQASDSEIREALTNLVFNAVDALPQGGTITLRTRHEGEQGTSGSAGAGQLILEVADDGLGMDEATRHRCLEPYFTTKGERGTGLGLSMVYGTVQRLGGRIAIDSQPGQGTTVRLVLPVEPLSAPPPEPPLQPALDSSRRILVVDDDPLVLASLCEILQIDAHRVTAVQGGRAGIDAFAAALARGEPFDVVITDLGMPHVDGRQVALAVKSAHPATRVLMLTGWGRRMQQDDERPEHVDHMLSKPPRMADIRRALAGGSQTGLVQPARSTEE